MSRDAEAIIDERDATHGDAYAQMTTTGQLWGVLLQASGWTPPNGVPTVPAHVVDLLLILNKTSRAAHGDPAFADHWTDIKGYATLGHDHARQDAA